MEVDPRAKQRMNKGDTVAEAYDHVQLHYQAANGVDLIDKSLKRGSVVLDLGCGTGHLSSVLAERVGPLGSVVGVDPDEKRLEIAKTKFSHVENLQFFTGSNKNFPSGPYDVIFCTHVIMTRNQLFRKPMRI